MHAKNALVRLVSLYGEVERGTIYRDPNAQASIAGTCGCRVRLARGAYTQCTFQQVGSNKLGEAGACVPPANTHVVFNKIVAGRKLNL